MDELLSKARFVFGEQDWSQWHWRAKEYANTGTRNSPARAAVGPRWRALDRASGDPDSAVPRQGVRG
jgi:hypothetical protein